MITFPCLKLEGGLFAADLLDQIASGDAKGQKPADFGLKPSTHLTDEISAIWASAQDHWRAFQRRLERLDPTDPATSVTRDQWMIPLLGLFGYDNLTYQPKAAEADGHSYAISHRAGSDEKAPPVHIVGCRQSLDRRPESGRPRLAPHSLVQDYLNRAEDLWGVVTNGKALRILRDSQLLSRLAYIEFDLEAILEGQKFADFALLYRLLHRSRLPRTWEDASKCLLEEYRRITVEQGGRVRDHLRDGVEEAIRIFANGFLSHPSNKDLRSRILAGQLPATDFYTQLLRLIYRFLFLMVAEERGLITENATYHEHYSVERLRRLLDVRTAWSGYDDLWLSLLITFRLFEDEEFGSALGIPPLNGDLFNPLRTRDLNTLFLANRDFLKALWHLAMYHEAARTPWRRINYAALDVEELGSVYESLLDFQPIFSGVAQPPSAVSGASSSPTPNTSSAAAITFDLGKGTERKSTGSYYTPPELVRELIHSALVPVIQDRLAAAKSQPDREKAILSIKVCDPASGSGHFLLAAARRLGDELARIRAGGDEPSPEQRREAVRDVITHCIYAVDKNPLAVDLCRVALWLEGHTCGKPLTFLDHRVRHGDSLVGVFDLAVLTQGIPDGAYKPVTGDDKTVARDLKKQNKAERKGGPGLPFQTPGELRSLTDDLRPILDLPDDSPDHIRRKADAYQRAHGHGTHYERGANACDLWTAAFFTPLTDEALKGHCIPTTHDLRSFLDRGVADGRLLGSAAALAHRHDFFHWPLEFPDVFAQGGFDVLLGNPPWERTALEELEFFALRCPQVLNAPTTALRKQVIQSLRHEMPNLFGEYVQEKRRADAENKFFNTSGLYPLGARGRLNTYALFADRGLHILARRGRLGMVLQTGLATDAPMEDFWNFLVRERRLVGFIDFENRKHIFRDVHPEQKFALVSFTGSPQQDSPPAIVGFWLQDVEELKDTNKVYEMDTGDLERFSPNTGQPLLTRRRSDVDILRRIYSASEVCWHSGKARGPARAWVAMTSAAFSEFCRREKDLVRASIGDSWALGLDGATYAPLLEAKQIEQYDFCYATYAGVSDEHLAAGHPCETVHTNGDLLSLPKPRFWADQEVVQGFLKAKNGTRGWCLVYRDVTNVNNERTAIATVLPSVGFLQPLNGISCSNARTAAVVLACMNSLVCDFVARLRFTGRHLNVTTFAQLPIPKWVDVSFVVPRVVELTYTGICLKHFAEECGFHGAPFSWDSSRRAQLRCELDAAFAHFYGLTADDLAYALGTFSVLRSREERELGVFRTRDTALDIFESIRQTLKRDAERLGPWCAS